VFLRPVAKKELVGFTDTHEELVQFLMKRIRDNLHIVLAFSPANQRFAERARKFPSIISGVTIDWFLRWPSDALESVSEKFISLDEEFQVIFSVCTTVSPVVDTKTILMIVMLKSS